MKKFIPIVFMLLAPALCGLARSLAAEIAPGALETSGASSSLPSCVHSERDLASIRHVQKANPKTFHKYDGYRQTLRASSNLELAARLVYAETLAANCPGREDRLADLIAAVIGNRIRIRGDAESVIFQRDQFASSLNIYSESRYRDFLCPRDSGLWIKSLGAMRANLESSKPNAPILVDTVNYYLFRHSDRFKAPAWKLREATIADSEIRECIRVYRVPGWR